MIELRYMTTTTVNRRGSRMAIDEIVGRSVDVHLEDCGTSWMLVVIGGGGQLHLTLPKSEHKKGDALLFEQTGSIRVTRDGREEPAP